MDKKLPLCDLDEDKSQYKIESITPQRKKKVLKTDEGRDRMNESDKGRKYISQTSHVLETNRVTSRCRPSQLGSGVRGEAKASTES